VIMLLDLKASARRRFRIWAVVGGWRGRAFLWELGLVLSQACRFPPLRTGLSRGLTAVVRPVCDYLLPFEVTALLLLVAMIGVVLLSKKELE